MGSDSASLKRIWEFFKAGRLGAPFRKQHIIGEYIPDSICLPKKVDYCN
ncbi:MAG: DUF559 domain-containing protein [Bacteroidaceae bacterium]|nr:DUF559 domain-containing protein [Bacteroidaceae bacterium]